MKLSANPLVDAVDDVGISMAVHSLIMRSAEIVLEQNFGTWSPGVPWVFPFGKLTCKGLFSCTLVSNTQNCFILVSKSQGSRGLIHTTVDQNPSYKLKVIELVDLTTSGIVSRYTGYKPKKLVEQPAVLGNS